MHHWHKREWAPTKTASHVSGKNASRRGAIASLKPGAVNYQDKPSRFVASTRTAVDEEGYFHGVASLFNQPDMSNDVMLAGAFKTSLVQRPASQVRMLYQHNPGQVLGVWHQIIETQQGLFVKGQLVQDVKKSKELASLINAGALNGLSIGYHTNKARHNPISGIRELIEVDLWEISIVTFPMLPQARIFHSGASRLRLTG